MLARVRSATVFGIEAADVLVEVDVAPGLPSFTTVGLPDSAVRESRDRVRAAIRNAGLEFPVDRITVNLAPAELRKEGAAFDLPMALGILSATGIVKPGLIEDAVAVGELSLDGHIRPVRGVLPVALHCRRRGVPAAPRARGQRGRGRRRQRRRRHPARHPPRRPRVPERRARHPPSPPRRRRLGRTSRSPTVSTSPTCGAMPGPSARSRSPRRAATTS